MNQIDYLVRHYFYIVKYSAPNEAYLARCLELEIMAHGNSQEEAISKIKEATKVHLLMLEEDGDEISEPLTLEAIS